MNAETRNTLSVLINGDEYLSAVEGIANNVALFEFWDHSDAERHPLVQVTIWNVFRSVQTGSAMSVHADVYIDGETVGRTANFNLGGVDLSQDARRVHTQLLEWVRKNGDQFGVGVL